MRYTTIGEGERYHNDFIGFVSFYPMTQENSVVYDRDELRRFKSEAIVVAQCIVESQKAELHHRIQQNNWETKDYFPTRRF